MILIYWAKTHVINRASLLASMDICVDANAEKIKYIFMFNEENAAQSHDTKIANKRCESVAKFKYLGVNPNKSKFYL